MAKEKCGLSNCERALGPGAAEVGYEIEGQLRQLRVCAEHAWMLMNARPGTYRITPDKKLEAIPARKFFIK